jgi:peptidoglycan/LPS O-acetylase OafA/YrhL
MRYIFMFIAGGGLGALLGYKGYNINDPIYWAILVPGAIVIALIIFFFEHACRKDTLY